MTTQSTSTSVGTGSNANLTAASSTPIRIGSGAGSFHGTSASAMAHHALGNESPSPGGASGSAPQSSSVPSSSAVAAHLQQLQSQASASMGASNQSLGVVGVGSGAASITPPNSAGLRQSGAFDFKFMRRASLKGLLPKLPSADSLSNSPGPSSPGLANWATDTRDKYDSNQTDKALSDTSKLNRKESYKAQRKNYRREKKRVASELLNSLQDPAVVVLADWLKVRGTLKSWTKLWCVLKPGLLLLYKSPKVKSSHWVGTILLTSCQVIERPSKKDGFCFKLFHPLEQSIWAPRGPDKETIGAVVQPLPTAYLIFRAPSQAAGKCWMDALELSLRCSALLLRSNSSMGAVQGAITNDNSQISHETQWSEADYEKHFNDHAAPQKRYSQYLMVPGAEKAGSYVSSDTSVPSRSQTPLFQQLYTTMTNWERFVAGSADFQKIKNFRKFRKGKRDRKQLSMEGISTMGDFSDVSSVDMSPKYKAPHQSLKLKKRRVNKFTKSMSLGSMSNRSSSSIDDDDDDDDGGGDIAGIDMKKRSKSPRPFSAPPFMVNVEDLDVDSQNEAAAPDATGGETESESEGGEKGDKVEDSEVEETPYISREEEEFGGTGEQVEELAEENKSLIWCLLKQVRPGMDLSKVVLPTFILEPRSFLDKLSDSYYHADILSRAVHEDDPFTRMKTVVQWYLSGFYKKPKGLKKPYNPILGETFRCYWEHPNGSRTFYIAEQVSHHPPISAFYVTNRQDGFCISCSILAKSKFYGNSTSAVLDGIATVTLLPRGESYALNTPYAHCKGILVGTLSMELGGKINIDCENTGYKTELEFKLKPFLGGSDSTNQIVGKIKLGKETLATIQGHWDTEMYIKDMKTGEETILFAASPESRKKRLTRYVVPLDAQLPTESEKLWEQVSIAIYNDDQVGATEQKTVLEEAQRNDAKYRRENLIEWIPVYFKYDIIISQWVYKYADLRPWDPRNDVKQYEWNYKILTKTRVIPSVRRSISGASLGAMSLLQTTQNMMTRKRPRANISTEPDKSDSSLSPMGEPTGKAVYSKSMRRFTVALEQINKSLDLHSRQLALIHAKLERLQYSPNIPQVPPLSTVATSTSSLSVITDIIPSSLPQDAVIKAMVFAFLALFICFLLKCLFGNMK